MQSCGDKITAKQFDRVYLQAFDDNILLFYIITDAFRAYIASLYNWNNFPRRMSD